MSLTSSHEIAGERNKLHIRDCIILENLELNLVLLGEGGRYLSFRNTGLDIPLKLLNRSGCLLGSPRGQGQECKGGDTSSVSSLSFSAGVRRSVSMKSGNERYLAYCNRIDSLANSGLKRRSSVLWSALVSSSSKTTLAKWCSWTFSPTPGRSILASTPIFFRSSGFPTPDSSKMCGDFIAL